MPASQKLTAEDLNQIKVTINSHADEIDAKISKTSDGKIVGTNSYTLLAEDAGKVIYFTSNNNIIITLPAGLLGNTSCRMVKKGEGNLLFSPGNGAILQAKGNTIATKYDYALVIHEGNNVFGIYGSLTTSTIPSGTSSSWTTGHIWHNDGSNDLDGYLYEPIGYADNTNNYPAIIYLHGQGHIGSEISQLLGEGLPREINSGLELKSLVFCPQMSSAYAVWFEYLTDDALTWLINNRRVDVNRVYITGYSLGAEGCYRFVAANNTKAAAILPISGASGELTSSPATFRNVAYFGVQGTADTVTSHYNQTANAFEALNNLIPPPVVPPQIYLPYGLGHEEAVWNTGVYKKSDAIFDFEEWMLLHSRNAAGQADNYVLKAESSGHLHDYLTAVNLVSKLESSTSKNALQARLNTLKLQADPGVRFIIDLGGDNTNDTPGNVNNITEEAATTSNIIDVFGNATPFHFQIVNALSGNLTNTGLNGEIFGLPASFWKNGCRIGGTRSLKFKNLTPTNSYRIFVYAARDVNDYNAKEVLNVAINGATQMIFCGHQTLEFAEFDDVIPDVNHEITITLGIGMSREPYINGIVLIDKQRTPGVDTTPPAFSINPAATAITTTTMNITATLEKDGTIYAYAVVANTSAPSISTIKSSGESEEDTGNGVTIGLSSLTNNTAYDIYIVAEDLNGNTQAAPYLLEDILTLDAGDTTPPAFDTNPAAGNITPTSMDITAELNENGTVYALAVVADTAAPSIATIKATGESENDSGSGVTIAITGLTPDTAYDIYVVAEDLNANTQASAYLLEDETTLEDTTAPVFTTDPYVSTYGTTSLEVTAQLNEAGTLYAYAVAEGTSPAPDIATIKSSGVNDDEDSGSGVILEITGLTANTAYDIYVVAEDSYGNTQATATQLADESTMPSGSVVSRFNLNATAQNISGYIDVSGHPETGTYSGTDMTTGFGCRNAGTWNKFAGASANNSGGETSDDGGGFAYNPTAQQSIWFSYLENVLPAIELFNLDNGKTYTVRLFCTLLTGLVNSNEALQQWKIGSSDPLSVNARSNTSEVKEWTAVAPAGGIILLEAVNLVNDAQFFTPSVIEIIEE